MLKLFVPKPISEMRQLPMLAPPIAHDNRLFQHLPFSEYTNLFEKVLLPEEADAFLLPHYLNDLHSCIEYKERVYEHALRSKKKIIIFTTQDDPTPVRIENAIIIRPSAYASTLEPHEIVAPALIEDLGSIHGYAPLSKGNAPVIGFVGKADFETLLSYLKYIIKNYMLLRGVRREGTFFRRTALRLLAQDSRISCDTILRKKFGAHKNTIEVPIEQLRTEYIQNIKNSLFTLAPRGDGNYSLRFYETLSLGRIPILIDTDMPLPLRDLVNYEECIVRVPADRLSEISSIVHDFWSSHSDEELQQMQIRARAIFSEYLYYPHFLKHLFESETFKHRIAVY